MKSKPTRMTYALRLLSKGKVMSCVQISKAIIKCEGLTGNKAYYLPASISSKLSALVKKGVLISVEGGSIKGGKLYRMNNII